MVEFTFAPSQIKSVKKDEEEILFLGFMASDQAYCFHINYIKEILKIPKIFTLPQTPTFLKGVIELRGTILPILDLKERFSLGSVHPKKGRIIVLTISNQMLGILVDRVTEVFAVSPKEIKPTPLVIHQTILPFMEGMVLVKDMLYYILNPKNLLSAREYKMLESHFPSYEENSKKQE
ncbi:MAG: chemotaxis protein CheW [Acidobacteriota bacterium]|nr:purine-binding chemotaxis protein CheW [Thermoanaerobaculaceae bacterium]